MEQNKTSVKILCYGYQYLHTKPLLKNTLFKVFFLIFSRSFGKTRKLCIQRDNHSPCSETKSHGGHLHFLSLLLFAFIWIKRALYHFFPIRLLKDFDCLIVVLLKFYYISLTALNRIYFGYFLSIKKTRQRLPSCSQKYFYSPSSPQNNPGIKRKKR